MRIVLALLMFVTGLACICRSIARDDTDAITAAGVFFLAGCVLIR